MRIDISHASPPFMEEVNGKTSLFFTFLVFPKSFEKTIFLKKMHLSIGEYFNPDVYIIQDGEKTELDKFRLEGEEMVRLNLVFENLPPIDELFEENHFASTLTIYFLNGKEEEISIPFQFKGKKVPVDNKRIALESVKFKRCASNTVYFSLFFIVGILVLLNVWISQHNDVFNQVVPSILANVFLTAITLYLGFELGNLRHLFTNLRSTKDFLNTTELYFERDTLNLLKGKVFASVAGFTFLFMLFVPCWYYFPVTLDFPSEKYNSFLYQEKENVYVKVNSPKVYWKDLDSLAITHPLPNQTYTRRPTEAAMIVDLKVPLLSHFISDSTYKYVREKKYQLDKHVSAQINVNLSPFNREDLGFTYTEFKDICERKKDSCVCDLVRVFEGEPGRFIIVNDTIFDENFLTESKIISLDELKSFSTRLKVNEWELKPVISYYQANFEDKIIDPDILLEYMEFEFDLNGSIRDDLRFIHKISLFKFFLEKYSESSNGTGPTGKKNISIPFLILKDINTGTVEMPVALKLMGFCLSYQKVYGGIDNHTLNLLERLLKYRMPDQVNEDAINQEALLDSLVQMIKENPKFIDEWIVNAILDGSSNWGITTGSSKREEYVSRIIELMRLCENAQEWEAFRALHDFLEVNAEKYNQLKRWYFRDFARSGLEPKPYQKDYFLEYVCKTGWYCNPGNVNAATDPVVKKIEWKDWIKMKNGKPDQWFVEIAEEYGDPNSFQSKCFP
jgi:hypothetical protein